MLGDVGMDRDAVGTRDGGAHIPQVGGAGADVAEAGQAGIDVSGGDGHRDHLESGASKQIQRRQLNETNSAQLKTIGMGEDPDQLGLF